MARALLAKMKNGKGKRDEELQAPKPLSLRPKDIVEKIRSVADL